MQTTTSDAAAEGVRRECIDEVLAQAGKRLSEPQHEAFCNFARGYFHHVDTDDLKARSAEDHLGALLSCWQFAAQRDAGAPKLRVLSPSLAEHGWSSRHSVIEVINDDMPFLVDTTTMLINRLGLTLHLIVHPVLGVRRDARGPPARGAAARCGGRRRRRAARIAGCMSRSTAWSIRSSVPS